LKRRAWISHWGFDPICVAHWVVIFFLSPLAVVAAERSGLEAVPPVGAAILGKVVDQNGQPMAGVAVDVLDAEGSLVEGAAFTNENGEWLKSVPGPGTYYARTVGSWTPGYQPEAWNDIPCDGCDVVAVGTPIVVVDVDVPGIDFALTLKPSAKPLDLCEQVQRQFRAYHLAGPDDRKFQAVTNREIPASFIADLKALNVNWVAIMQMMYVDDALDSTLEYEPKGQDLYNVNWSFTEEDLEFLIKTFQAHGINVYVTLAISPSLAMASEHPFHRHEMGAQSHSLGPDESWPWNVNHPDHGRFVEEFWRTYRDRAVELAGMLERNGVTLYSIGTETRNLFRTREVPDEGFPNDFRTELQRIVDDVRAVFSGLLTYDMHWGEFAYPNTTWGSLWDDLDLDIIGVSAYIDNILPEVPVQVPDVPTLEASLDNIFRTQFLPVQKANSGRPMLFLEGSFSNSIGAPYTSHHNLGQTDTDEDGNGVNDGQETQANLFQALFNVMNRYRANVKGVFIWDRFMVSDEDWQFMIADDPIILGTRGLLADEVVRQVYGDWESTDASRIFRSSFERCPRGQAGQIE